MVKVPSLDPLTSVRFFAAIAVVLFHFGKFEQIRNHAARISSIIEAGYIGVSMFFVLSGFILTYTASFKKDLIDPVVFWQARFARIYPLYLAGLLLSITYYLVSIGRHGASPLALPLAPLLLQAWAPNAALAWNSPAWTLSVEAFFYFIFPFFIKKMIETSRSRLIIAGMLTWLVLLLPPFFAANLIPGALNATAKDNLLWLNVLKFDPIFHLGEFVMGMLTAKIFLTGRNTINQWYLGMSAVALILLMAFSPHIPYIFLHNGLLAPLFALIIYGLASSRNKIMNSRALIILGESSYALYILHVPLWILLRFFTAKIGFELQSPPGFILYLLIVILISVLSFFYFERPARRFITHWFSNRAKRVRVKPTSS